MANAVQREGVMMALAAVVLVFAAMSGGLRSWAINNGLFYLELAITTINTEFPEDLRGLAKGALLTATWGTVAGVPSWGVYQLSRHWSNIRYTYITVKDTSDVYQWIETYVTGSQNEQVKKQTTQLDLRLGKESAKASDSPYWYDNDQDDDDDDDSLQFDMATNTGGQTWLDFEDHKGATRQIMVYRQSKQIGGGGNNTAAREVFTYQMIVRNEPVWKIWRWGDSSHAVSVAESFVELCKAEHKAKTNGKLELHALTERWGSFHWTKVGNVNKRSLSTIHLPPKLKQDIVSDCERFLEDRELYERIGIPYRRGYLLYGEPGCGKSSFLKALASHLNVPLCKLDLTGGGGAKLSDSAIEIVVNKAPQRSILYVEEVDTLFLSKEEKKREGGGNNRGRRLMIDSDSDCDSDDGPDGDEPPGAPDKAASKPASMNKAQLRATDALLSRMIGELQREADSSPVQRLAAVATLIADFAADDAEEATPPEGVPGAVKKRVSIETPSSQKPGPTAATTPLDSTTEWKELIAMLETEARYNAETNSFTQPAEDLKALHESVTFNLQVTLQDTQEMQKIFKPVDLSKLLAKLQSLQETIQAAERKPDNPEVDPTEQAATKPDDTPYLSKASFREPAKNTICSFGGLLQALDGVMAQEGRMVFFTTNHIEKLDEALIRPGRMDRKFEFRHAESEAVAEQFIRLFSKAPDTNPHGERVLPTPEHVAAQAAAFEEMIKTAEATVEGFKPPTLAESQVYFQTKFREPHPMEEALKGAAEYFKFDTTALQKSTSVKGGDGSLLRTRTDSSALTRQFTALSTQPWATTPEPEPEPKSKSKA